MVASVVFPGQASQYCNMGQFLISEIPDLRKIYECAGEILERDIYKAIFTEKNLFLENKRDIQPAIFITSIVAYSYFNKKFNIRPQFLAGHSLGELTALTVSGCFSFEDGLRIVDKRSKYMMKAVEDTQGVMTSIRNINPELIFNYCEYEGNRKIFISCFNSKDQVVIAGDKLEIEKAERYFLTKGAKVNRLNTLGAFHTPFMKSAAEKLKSFIDSLGVKDFDIPVISNYTGRIYSQKEDVSKLLYLQMINPVQWDRTVRYLEHSYVDTVIEVGPSATLKNIIDKDSFKIKVLNLENKEDREGLLKYKNDSNKYVYRDLIRLCQTLAVNTPVLSKEYNVTESISHYNHLLNLSKSIKKPFYDNTKVNEIFFHLESILEYKGYGKEQINAFEEKIKTNAGILFKDILVANKN